MSTYRGQDGSAHYGNDANAVAITSSSASTEKVLTATHGYSTLDYVRILGHTGAVPALNGSHVITVTSSTEFTLDDVANITTGGTGGTATKLTSVGNLLTWEIITGRASVDPTVKGDKHQQIAGGLVSGSATLTALLDYVTGQKVLVDLLEIASPASIPGSLVVTTVTGKTFTVSALYTGHTIGSPEGDNPVTAQFSFITTSDVTIGWV